VLTFVARVGKFCGKEYMVDDGQNVLNTYDKHLHQPQYKTNLPTKYHFENTLC